MRPVSATGKIMYYVVPLLLWMAFIFCASTDAGSADHTRPLVGSIIRRLLPTIVNHFSPETIDRIDWNIRKAALLHE